MIVFMQKITKKRLFLYSFLLSIWIYFIVRVVWVMVGGVRDSGIMLVVVCASPALLAAAGGYLLLRRKIAAVAAGSVALLLMGVHSFIGYVASVFFGGWLLLALGIIAGAGVFYGWYSILIRVKRSWLMACIGLVVGVAIGGVLSAMGLYIMRTNFDV